jgi:predicted ATP-grasp superfamily ATP-dependent carboligase
VEVLELATGRPLLAEHSRAFGADVPLCGRRSSTPCVAKAVLFAPRGLCFRKSVESETGPWSVPELADVPADGTRIREGEPVCTLFGSGESPRAAIEHLSGRHARLCGSLGISNSSSHAILEEAFERGYHCLY